MYGGSAGGGKSDALLVDAIRYVGRGYGTKYLAVLFRRTYPDLEKSLIRRSFDLYPRLGGEWKGDSKLWTFPAGESVYFAHCQYEKDVYSHQGAAYQYIGFDELTQFTKTQYLYLMSRLRSAHGVPLRMRGATNPGGEGHEWVFDRWAPWLNPQSPIKAPPGEVKYFAKCSDETERLVQKGEHGAFGRTFVPSSLSDNPYLSGTDYAINLEQLDPVTRAQLRDGNWLIKPARGLYFKRSKLTLVEESPVKASRIRYWDRASTGETEIAKRKRSDPDYTVGLRLAKTSDGLYFVEDVVRFRGSPFEVQDTILQTAKLDGKSVQVGIEQDPGQAGEAESLGYVRMLDGFNVRRYPARQDKVTRAQPASAQWEAGNFRVLNRPWSQSLVQELEAFPEGGHDDQVDALSGAHMALSKPITEKVDGGVVHRPQVFDNDSGW